MAIVQGGLWRLGYHAGLRVRPDSLWEFNLQTKEEMNTENIKTSDLVKLAEIQSNILADCGYKHKPIGAFEWTYDIQIDKVYKDGEWLCVKTGNVVRRVKTEIAKEILKLLME